MARRCRVEAKPRRGANPPQPAYRRRRMPRSMSAPAGSALSLACATLPDARGADRGLAPADEAALALSCSLRLLCL